jgi:hypothetical protein
MIGRAELFRAALPWVLNVTFREDGSHVRALTTVRNFALLRKITSTWWAKTAPLKSASVVKAKSGLG